MNNPMLAPSLKEYMKSVGEFCQEEDLDGDLNGKPDLIWVDIETTGFNRRHDFILEVGMVATTRELAVVDLFHVIIRPMTDFSARMDEVVRDMHTKSGLLELVETVGVSRQEANERMCDWLDNIYGDSSDPFVCIDPLPMAGSSVHFDRPFLQDKYPEADQQFHYRNVDVSTIKELCRRYNPDVYSHLEEYTTKKGLHRALPDIADSIKEFRFYLDNFLFATEW